MGSSNAASTSRSTGDEVGLILRIRGDGYGVGPWSVDRTLSTETPMQPQIDEALEAVARCVEAAYINE